MTHPPENNQAINQYKPLLEVRVNNLPKLNVELKPSRQGFVLRSSLQQRFIFVYRPMLGKVQVLHLMERFGKACRTACLRKRLVKPLHQNSKNESLPNIGCLYRFMFLYAKEISLKNHKSLFWSMCFCSLKGLAVLTKDEEIAKYSKRNGEMSFLFRYFVYDYLKFYNYGKRKEKHKATKHEADGREIGRAVFVAA